MGRNIKQFDYPINVDKKKVQEELDHYVAMEDWQEGCSGLNGSIIWKDTTFQDYDSASEWIDRQSLKHDYLQIAVKYLSLKDRVTSVKLQQQGKKVDEAQKNWYRLEDENVFANMKSEFITCKNCGSKINKQYLRKNCPVCRADMRSPTQLNKIAKAKIDHEKALQKYRDIKEALEKKAKKEPRWLVKIEYHT